MNMQCCGYDMNFTHLEHYGNGDALFAWYHCDVCLASASVLLATESYEAA